MTTATDTCWLCGDTGAIDDPNNCGGCETCARHFGPEPTLAPCPACQPETPAPDDVSPFNINELF